MSTSSTLLGTVNNLEQLEKTITVPGVTLVLGGTAVGAFVGFQIGGPMGAAVGALVGAFAGALAAGYIKKFTVILHKDGKVEVIYETRF